jgi:deoxyadenosine/deoxycytidine kinase
MIVIDIDKINYADNKEDLAKVISIIDAEVNGLF